jgi:anti-sigma B factor antagonist
VTPRVGGASDRVESSAKYRARPDLACTEHARDDGTVVVALRGDFDLATAGTIKSRLTALVRSATPRIVVDLHDVTFLDSVGIAVLVHAWRESDIAGLSFGLAAVPEQARNVLDITGTAALFRIVHLDEPAADRSVHTRTE